jgi:membrane protein implicated in regulation of membrane protease activity
MMWFSVMFSTLLSLAWFTLNMEIVPSQALVVTAQWLGVIAFTVGPTVQFIAWSAYVMKSTLAVQRVVAAEENALDAAMAFKVLQERRNAMRKGEAAVIADLMLDEWRRLRGYDHGPYGASGTSDVITASVPMKESDKPNGGVVPNPTKRGPGRPPKQPAP